MMEKFLEDGSDSFKEQLEKREKEQEKLSVEIAIMRAQEKHNKSEKKALLKANQNLSSKNQEIKAKNQELEASLANAKER